MEGGFITLHRKILDNPIWKNSQLMHLFLTLLLLANHEEKSVLFNGKLELVGRGQLITGRHALEDMTGIPAGSIPRYLEILKKLEILNIKPNNKFSLITIVKYSDYQSKKPSENSKPNNQRTTSEQPVNTNNNENNENNENKEYRVQAARPQDTVNKIFSIFQKINPGINYGNKTSRHAAQWLIDKYGPEKACGTAEYAVTVFGKDYAPSITTPYQLKENIGKLLLFHKRQQNSPNKTNAVIL